MSVTAKASNTQFSDANSDVNPDTDKNIGSNANMAESGNEPGHLLNELRGRIDQVDNQLAQLLEERAELVFAVGEYKRAHQLPIYDPVREAEIKKRIRGLVKNSGTLSPAELESLFMTLVERFRYFEGLHLQHSIARSRFHQSHLNFNECQNVVLCGFGLLGASFYLALHELVPNWRFYVLDPKINRQDFLSWQLSHQFDNIELIEMKQFSLGQIFVLGASVEINAAYLAEAEFPENSLVFDLGSTKTEMAKAFEKRKSKHGFTYIGGHPLAGKERSGFQNADALLFYDKVFCWTKAANQALDEKVKATVEIISLCLGAKAFWTTPEEHDLALAWTSHLPQILSNVLARCLAQKEFAKSHELFPRVISDFLRISGSTIAMWKPIIESNQAELQRALAELIKTLSNVQVELVDATQLEALFTNANEFYKKFQGLNKE